MTPDRLQDILAAYGARPERWPADERADAKALIPADSALGERLAAEARLDALLDGHRVPAPHGALVGGIIAGAPRRSAAARWWAGLGFAGAGLAGIAAGILLLPLAAPHLPGSRQIEDPITLFTPVYGNEAS